jgi:dipeptidyl aminopeptidase/acylaminoacyl peptidase
MFTFTYRFSLRLLLVITLSVVGFAGIQRTLQTAYPPILYSETTNFSLYTKSIGCASFWEVCKPSERLLLEGMYSFPVAEWSPNGRYIAVHQNEGWVIYPTECLLVLKTCQPVPIKVAVQDIRLAWGPDGTTIASYASTRYVSTTILTSGCWQADSPCLEKTVLLTDYYLLTEVAWSSDGSRMVFSDFVQTGLVWLDTACFDNPDGCGKSLHIIPVGLNRPAWPSLSRDGRRALVMIDTSGNGTSQQLFLVNLDTGSQQQLTARPGTAEFPDWSADERYVLFSGFATARSGDLLIYLMDMQRHITLPLMGHEGRDLAFANWGYPPN